MRDDKQCLTDSQQSTRRRLLKRIGLFGSGAGMVVLAGCQGGTTPEPESTQTLATGGEESEETAGTGTPEQQIKTGGSLRLGINQSFERLDQRVASQLPVFTSDILDTPFVIKNNGEIVPHLVSDMTTKNGGSEMVWELQEGVTFHDGSEFNAEYMKWFLTDFLANGAGTSYIVEDRVDTVTVEDSHRVRVNLQSPSPNMLWDLSSGWATLHSREAVEEHGEEYGQGTNFASTGPYKVASRSGDRSITLERYADWSWPVPHLGEIEQPRPETVEYQVFSNDATLGGAFEAGDLDGILAAVPNNKIDPYLSNDDFTVKAPRKSNTFDFIFFNLDPEKAKDPVVAEELSLRKAISYAIDRDALASVAYHEQTAAPNPKYVSRVVPSYNVPDQHSYNFDLEQAKQVLRDDGWNVEPNGVSTKNGKEASFELNPWNTSSATQQAQVIQSMLQKIGVEVEVVPLDYSTAQSRGRSGDFSAIMYTQWTWGNANTMWWITAPSLIDSYFANTRAAVQYPELSERLSKARNATTWDERVSMFKDYHTYLLDDVVPIVGGVAIFQPDAHQSHLQDWNASYQEWGVEYVWNENW